MELENIKKKMQKGISFHLYFDQMPCFYPQYI